MKLKIPDSKTFSYAGNEPVAVVAFVYRDADQWRTVFVPDN